MKRRVLAFFIMVMMLLSLCAVPAFATTDEAIMEVTALGILKGDGNGNLRLEDDVTRGEFATLVTRLLNYDSLVIGRKTMFDDVPESHVHAGAIALISEFGYINGDGNGRFYPDNPITVQDCLKILVCALGYELDAKAKGGYPTGYLATATRFKLNKGLERSIRENATRGDVATMIYQALYVDILEPYATTDGDYTHSGDNFKHRFEFHEDIYHTTGIVTANYDTWLSVPNGTLERTEIEVDGVRYTVGNLNTRPYLGRLVEVYYHKEPSGKRTILNLALSYKNSQTIVDRDDFISISATELNYRDENRSKEAVMLDKDKTVYVYNNRIITDYVMDDLVIEQGRYECVSNDWDDICEYVFIYDYESSIVDRVNVNGCIYLKQDLKVFGKDNIIIDANSRDITYNLMDTASRKLSLSEVIPGNVVTVYKSLDGSVIDVVVSNKTITGTIDRLTNSGRKVDIGGSLYGFIKNFNDEELIIGNGVIAYVNEFDKIVYMEPAEDSEYKYGYVLQTGDVWGIGGGLQARILVSGSLTEATETENEETGSGGTDGENNAETTISSLYCKNSEVLYLDFAEKVKFDGKMTDSTELSINPSYPVRFKTNIDGKISVMETIDEIVGLGSNIDITGAKTDYTGLTFNDKNSTFYNDKTATIVPFGVNTATKVICIPTIEGASDKQKNDINATDAEVLSLIRIAKGSTYYHISGYMLDEDTNCVELVVLKDEMKESTSRRGDVRITDEYALVKETYVDLDDKGMEIKSAKIVTKAGEAEIMVAPTMINHSDNAIFQDGDLIVYNVDFNGNIYSSRVVSSFGSDVYEDNKSINVNGTDLPCPIGVVENIKRLLIDSSDGERYHALTTSTAGETTYMVRTAAPVFVYDKRTEDMVAGTFDDVMYGDLVCTATNGDGEIKAIVVVRGE